MTRIAFIGLGNMGGGMAARQVVGGRSVNAFDLSEAAVAKVVGAGATGVKSVAEAVKDADVVITMLPAGPHVRKVYADDILPNAPKTALLIDCSTIDVDSARAVATQAKAAGFRFADAPVSGGTAAADAGTLAFMVGCDEADFAAVEDALKPMSRVTIRAGDHGAGQAAKICNNMLLGDFDDRHVRSVCVGREARPRAGSLLRDRVEVFGPVLVAVDLRAVAGRRPANGRGSQL